MVNHYRQQPNHNDKNYPKGIKYIVGNEACERFSYYGMNAILYVYIVSLYVGMQMQTDQAQNLATSTVHFFKTGVYAFPMIGAIIADRLAGKYNTILWLSLVYCMGHVVLAFAEGSLPGLYLGLGLIAVGSGGIKPCVSAHVGDQFGRSNWNLIPKIYQAFYFSINFGSFFSTLLIPLTQKWFGWQIAFLIPGIFMGLATIVFWMGRNQFVHIPATPGGKLGFLDATSSMFLFLTVGSLFFTAGHDPILMLMTSLGCFALGLMLFSVRQSIAQDHGFLAVSILLIKEKFQNVLYKFFAPTQVGSTINGTQIRISGASTSPTVHINEEDREATLAVWRIMSVFLMVSVFWALFDQHSSSWIRQAQMMDLTINLPFYGSVQLLASQVPSINPILVMLLIPMMLYGVYPLLERLGIMPTPLRRMTAGMALTSLSFVSVALIQSQLDAGVKMHVGWQIIPYVLITLAEVLVSVTGLEFAYTQAPKRMKSTIMGFWLLTVSLGNVLVAFLARFSSLSLVNFFWLFAGLMAIAALIFGLRAMFYTVKDFTQ